MVSTAPGGSQYGQPQQRWANNSVLKYYSNAWGRILVFVFVFGWFFETEYYSYSGDFLKTECYLYLYLGNFFNPNIIRIRVIFSNRIVFVFDFFPNNIYILYEMSNVTKWQCVFTFRCTLEWYACKTAYSQCSHLFSFSPLCILKCAFKLQIINFFRKPNDIRIRSFVESWIIFVFVSSHFWKAK